MPPAPVNVTSVGSTTVTPFVPTPTAAAWSTPLCGWTPTWTLQRRVPFCATGPPCSVPRYVVDAPGSGAVESEHGVSVNAGGAACAAGAAAAQTATASVATRRLLTSELPSEMVRGGR